MEITSTEFQNNEYIPVTYTCDGKGVNPPLSFHNIPPSTKSLVLIMDDPDVPPDIRADRMWDHWVVFNIPSDVRKVEEGSEPPGIHGVGTAGNTNYYPPCPPDGEHRYRFILYALDMVIDLEERSTKQEVEKAIEGHVIEKSELIGKYKRK